ncbi:hypothetical protein EON63_03180 [archaeon]|nr:MAG: hypothetical protein EON63_03180 [archaeon]
MTYGSLHHTHFFCFPILCIQVTAFMGQGGAEGIEAMITKLEQLKGLIDQVWCMIYDERCMVYDVW